MASEVLRADLSSPDLTSIGFKTSIYGSCHLKHQEIQADCVGVCPGGAKEGKTMNSQWIRFLKRFFLFF